MAESTVTGYIFKDFQSELERLPQMHPHKVRREPETTLRDPFAYEQLVSMQPELASQVLQGWSRSYYIPSKHLEAILQYASLDIPITNLRVDLYQQSIRSVQNGLSSLPSVKAYDVLTELDKISFKSSSAAGYNYTGVKGPINGENHKIAIRRAKALMWSVKDDNIKGLEHAIKEAVPDIGYTRTQLANLTEKSKVRNVWGRAFHYILLEGTVADPLQRAFINNNTFYHIGKDPTLSVPKLLSKVASESKWIYALDWKSFDASVSRFEINTAFDIIKSKVIFPNSETELTFEICRHLFIHKKIAAPDGYIYWAHKGIPSGSYFTSVIGSIVNKLRIDYLWRYLTGNPPLHCFTQGDDSLIGDKALVHPDTIAEVANSIGWYFNPAKTEYSTIPEMITFLGRTYQGGLNKRDLTRCLRLLIYPEYPVETGRISAYRARSIAEDAGKLSQVINELAHKLKRNYGVASETEVPDNLKIYVHGI